VARCRVDDDGVVLLVTLAAAAIAFMTVLMFPLHPQ
jgi:hypothetical protein